MSKRVHNSRIPTQPTEKYDPIINRMNDLLPVTKKPRAIHPRQHGHNNKQRQQYQQHHPKYPPNPEPRQHQQPLDQPREHEISNQKIKFQSQGQNNYSTAQKIIINESTLR